MKTSRSGMNLSVVAIALLGFMALAFQEGAKSSEDLHVVDLAKCDLKVVEVENVDHVQLDSKTVLTPSKKDARLVLLHLRGVSPEIGVIPCHAPSFGVHYRGEESVAFSAAKSFGIRGKTEEGKPFEVWFNRLQDMINLRIETPGEEVDFWLAVEIPKDVKAFVVRIPTQLAEPVQVRGVVTASLW